MAGEETATGKAILKEAQRHPLLEREEERDLAQRAGAGDREATRRLVGSHLRYVIKIARPYFRLGLPKNDLLQQGTLGLVQAVRRFDPSRGVRLSTYAIWWIRASIQDYVHRSRSLIRNGSVRRGTAARPAGEADREPVEGTRNFAGAVAAGLSDMASSARRMVQIHGGHDASGQSEPLLDRLPSDAPTPEQWLTLLSQQRFARQSIASALDALSPRERFVIRKRYFEDARPTFAAIGRELGVSKDRVRQLEAKALGRLRELLGPVAADLK